MHSTAVSVWRDILTDIRKRVGDGRYNLLFTNTVAVSYDTTTLEVGVASAIMADYLESHYKGLVEDVAARSPVAPKEIRFVVDGELFRNLRREENAAKADVMETAEPDKAARFDTRRYTLDNFVVGPCNAVAYAAARKVAECPGEAYNPLFIHGGVGLGKTHLLLGIAGALKGRPSNGAMEYVSAEAFTNRYIFAIKNHTLDAFRSRYRKARLLVIDDIHFLTSKPGIQDEFLNTYNALTADGGQIVMASDSHPKLIGKLADKLMTRFLSGMVVRLDKPGYETRLAIVRSKAGERKLSLPESAAERVARRLKGSVREIEGVVNTLAAHAGLTGGTITAQVVNDVVNTLTRAHCRPVRLPEIEAVVTAYAGLSEGELKGRRRTRAVSGARHLAMYLARTLGGFSYSEIGGYFGGRNHSSVVSASAKTARLVKTDEGFARDVEALKSEFGL